MSVIAPAATSATPETDLAFVDEAVERTGRGREATIPILQALQEHYGWLPSEALERVCELTDIRPADVTGVSTFYTEFRHRPVGRHMIAVCHGTACYVKGAQRISDAFDRHLGIQPGEDTDRDRLFTMTKVPCLGCCSLAVAVQAADTIYGHVTPETVPSLLADVLERARLAGLKKGEGAKPLDRADVGEIRICVDSCCIARGCGRVYDALLQAVEETGVRAVVKKQSCVVVCSETPLIEIVEPGKPPVRYARVFPEDVKDVVLKHFRPAGIGRRISVAVSRAVERILTDDAWAPVDRYAINMRESRITAFLGPQRHIAMEHYGLADPSSIDEYIGLDGYRALRRALTEMTPEEVIDEIARSGLRGRGGAGFPTGAKWKLVRSAPGDVKYLVMNGDEGDPGAFMDRMLLESFPYRVLEGITIAAYAVGVREGYMYIRSEYPFALRRIGEALKVSRERGFLGERIMGTDFGFDLEVRRGAGAFVCGEETALIASVEGRRGMPRLRPPFPSEKGLRGKPTLVNNVETYSLVPWILRHGAREFASLGTEKSKGTKVFALAGKCVRGGLIEVPMGISIRRIVEEIGGGIAGGREFKAALVGGPSGGCVPAGLADTPVDYDALTALGAMMGSGGLVILDDSDCMVDIARYFLECTQDQSCGKCTFCRVGTRRMLDVLERLCRGEGRKEDLKELEELASNVRAGSLCGLGKTAPNPVLTTMKYFREEYEAHIEKRCPAMKCKALIKFAINEKCIGCTRCAQACPADAIAMRPYERHEIDQEKCTHCGMCLDACPAEAIDLSTGPQGS